MRVTRAVKKILSNYEADTIATKTNLARIMCTGTLAGTGKMVILPVDQGFEHGPARSFEVNDEGYDPHYHYSLAIESGCNAYAAPLGFLEAGADTFLGQIPTILKMNSANSLYPNSDIPNQAVTASVSDAVRLGCAAIGFTIYPGSEGSYEMYEEIRELSNEAKEYGIATVIWSYTRGGFLTKDGETALDIIGYGAHMACQLGAHIVKVKLPSDHLELPEAKKVYEAENIARSTMAERVAHIKQCCFNGRRIVIFSGGGKKGDEGVLDDARAIYEGGGNGSIIGRNAFQRPKAEGIKLLKDMMKIYQGKDV
ncbi:MAG: fructose-bisphosphate aldolase [Rickettsiales bacterium]|nr:fructose-bisphosphate aldolase [Rickettsiales bacterium]|tara:strand:+ start:1257 stop:2189 length:933 start_codon:yes stop_codon:yes gene_type:complete